MLLIHILCKKFLAKLHCKSLWTYVMYKKNKNTCYIVDGLISKRRREHWADLKPFYIIRWLKNVL